MTQIQDTPHTPGTAGSPSTKDQAQQAAGTAADEGRHVAGVAADEARNVAGEAKAQARGLVDDARGQVEEQARTQRDRAVGTLQTLGDDLDTMAADGGTQGLAADLARQAADRVRALGSHLDGREPGDLLDDVRRFARQRPGTFLLGALAAGVVAGRLARGAKDAGNHGDGTSRTGSSTGTGPGTPTIPATPVTPATTSATATDAPVPTASPDQGPLVPGSGPAGGPGVGASGIDEDPLGADDPAVGAAVPPNPTGRYEP